MNPKMEKRKKIREKFNAQDDTWRIEAVIHDGNWYDFNKWKRVAKIKDDKILQQWIENNNEILIKSDLNSYRVNYDEIVRWYKQENIDIEEKIVPSNFPPKLWANTTETDVFMKAPRRRVGTVNFKADSPEILNKCMDILKGTATIMLDDEARYRAYGLSAIHMKNLLCKGLTKTEYDSLDIKTRSILLQRELIDLPEAWLAEAIPFYANKFAPSILQSHMSTINIYLPDKYDVESQIIVWVINAMKKFNEKASVPFSGYLSSVLRHWPYDLPDEFLGKELAAFQRDRKRAIDQAQEEANNDEDVDIDQLTKIMNISKSKYISLNNEHRNWLASKNATTLTWEDSANEKAGDILGKESRLDTSVNMLYKISLAAVKAALETKDWKSANILIAEIDKNDIDEEINNKLSKEFVSKFAVYLKG